MKPYYAVIFTSLLSKDTEGYSEMGLKMKELAEQQPGYLGFESAREDIGITISYWESPEAIKAWKAELEHLKAQKMGRSKWYQQYTVRICKVEREYEFKRD